MKIYQWKEIEDLYERNESLHECKNLYAGLSVGSFDGIHLGHRLLLETLVNNCKKNGFHSGVVSFTRPLPSIKKSSIYYGDVSTLKQRLNIFEQFGLDFVILVDFTKEFASLSGSEFFNILKQTCHMKYLVEGVDFKCGYKGATGIDEIKSWTKINSVSADFIEPVIYKTESGESIRISSSSIRTMISEGKIQIVNMLLGRNYEIDLNDFSEPKSCIQVLPKNGKYEITVLYNDGTDKNVKIDFDDNIISPIELKNCLSLRFLG